MTNNSRKKRTAEVQITKDDDPKSEEEEGEEGVVVSLGIPRASEGVLKSRRIIHAKRPVTGDSGNNGGSSTKVSANPFQQISLANNKDESRKTVEDESKPTKEDPSSAAAGDKKSEKSESTFVFGSNSQSSKGFASLFGGGFGSSSSNTSSSFGGFAAAAAATSAAGFGQKSTAPTGFGFSSEKEKLPSTTTALAASEEPTEPNNQDGVDDDAKSNTSGTLPPVLPETYEYQLGEENENILWEGRVKTMRFVTRELQEENVASSAPAAPHIPSATTSFGTSATSNANDTKETSSSKRIEQSWQDVGIGLLKVLEDPQTGKRRLLQRSQIQPNSVPTKVLLNIALIPDTTTLQLQDNHTKFYVKMIVLQDQTTQTYLVRFPSLKLAQEFEQAVVGAAESD